MNTNTASVNVTTPVIPKSQILKNLKTDETVAFINQSKDKLVEDKEIEELKAENKKNQQLSKEKAEEIADNIDKMVKLVSSNLQFKVHENTNRIMIRVVNTQTKEVIREVPPEQVLNANAKFREVLHLIGILMDEKA